ncbi:Eukaryotic-type carbonic anhydrase [Phytophthora infestans]|uniref:carbonic anhydrase n=1 Tax=Phytophthora infestans TaxID=4787 RepID=A0A8S9UAC4_PHYIN|nr:Eukaryotic-type carbonic anhydrase [Phytophthora infestans]
MVSVLDGMEAVTPDTATTMSLGSYANVVNTNAVRTYNYPGSLTTPGCDEIVDWWVVQQPMSISSADFTRLQTQLKELSVTDNGNNARPVLPLNGRTVVSLQ